MIYGKEKEKPVELLCALVEAGVPEGVLVEAEVHLSRDSRVQDGGTGLWDLARHAKGKAFKKVGRAGDWIETGMPLYTGRVRPPSPPYHGGW